MDCQSAFDWRLMKVRMPTNSVTTWRLLYAVMIWAASALVAQASIEIPECSSFAFELNLDKSAAAGAGSSGHSSSPSAPQDESSRDKSELLNSLGALAHSGAPTGTSANSLGSGSASHPCAVRAANAVVIVDSNIAGWLSGEYRFAIPMPPVNSLLRPPQAESV
jgi:hypothetical protein